MRRFLIAAALGLGLLSTGAAVGPASALQVTAAAPAIPGDAVLAVQYRRHGYDRPYYHRPHYAPPRHYYRPRPYYAPRYGYRPPPRHYGWRR